jgi:uncharacterized membrane protein YwzB
MIEIEAFYIPLILLVVSWILQIIANRSFGSEPNTQGGFLMIFVTAIIAYLNIVFYGVFYGVWGIYWLFTHVRII